MSTRTTTANVCPTTTTPTPPTPTSNTHAHLVATRKTLAMSSLSTITSDKHTHNINNNNKQTNLLLLNTMYTHAESISWRLRQYCIEAVTASSRRRRRRRDDISNTTNNNNYNNNRSSCRSGSNSNYTMNCNSSDCYESNNNNNNNMFNNNNNNNFAYSTPSVTSLLDADYYDYNNNSTTGSDNFLSTNLSKTTTTTATGSPAIQLYNVIAETLSSCGSFPAATYIAAILILTTLCSFCAASPCDLQSWWDPLKDKCIPCTVCEGDLIPLRPCQLHRDTICGSIYDLKIDWVVLAKTEPNWKERRKDDDNNNIDLEQQLTHEELQQLQDGTLPMDWQTTALFIAVLACLLFFMIAAGILVHHMRQWRRMERRLDQDVEELSTKLMAKLAEVQSMDGGTFFIGNADALGVATNFQPQHVLLPEKSTKHHERRILKTLQPGNVYIEESSSKG